MTTATSATRLSVYSQFEQLGFSISSLLSSVTESTNAAFRRAYVKKRDSEGNIKFYNKKETVTNPTTGEEKVIKKKVDALTYIEDIRSGEMYFDEPIPALVAKCALLVLGLPFYAFGKMSWHAINTSIEIGAIACKTIFKAGEEFSLGRLYETSNEIRYGLIQASHVLGNGLFEIVKAPLFALGCELAAVYGIFKPYHGRKFEAIIENAWQEGASFREDFRKIPARSGEDCWMAFKKDIQEARPFYLAHCFQSRGNTKEPRMIVTRRDNL